MSCRNYDPCLDSKLNQIGSYASVARQSAQSATASAAAADSDATAAAASAAAAAASAEIAGIYLGPFATPPTVDNQGGPLQEGMLYYNTANNTLFVWNGSSWSAIQDDEIYLGGFAAAPVLNNQGFPLALGNLYWNSVTNNLWAYDGVAWIVTNFNETTPFLATGTTFARTLANRFADVVNVKDFGAVGDGVTDDATAIQAAIDYAIVGSSRRLLFFPAGNYVASSALFVRGQLHIMGAGRSRSVLFSNHSGDGIVFEPVGAGSSNIFLDNCKLSSFSVSRNTAGNGGSAIWLRQCNQFTAEDIGVSNKNVGFRVTGGQFNLFNNIRCQNFSPFTKVLTSPAACFLFERADLGGGNFQECYTVSINNITASTGSLLPQCIRIHSINGLNISNGYFAFAWSSLLRFARQSTGDQITGVNISNCYFDAVDNIRDGVVVVPKCVHVSHDLGGVHEGCRQTRFSNCFFANNDGLNEYLVAVQKFCELQFSNCSFGNASAEGFSVSDGANVGVSKGRYMLNGCLFKNLSELDPSGFSVYIKDAEYVVITGCMFYNTITSNSHIRLTGELVSGVVVGNVGDTATTTLTTSGLTVSDKLIALNTSDPKIFLALPTSSVGLPSGAMWNDGGIVKIVP
jgi:hypothetical protein